MYRKRVDAGARSGSGWAGVPIHPHKLFVIATIIFLLMLILSPFSSNYSVSKGSAVFFILNVVALYIPIFIYKCVYKCNTFIFWENERRVLKLVNLLNFTMLMSVLGNAARFVDKFVIRGVSLSGDMAQRLESIQDTSGTVLGLMAAFIYPLSISSFILVRYLRACSIPISKVKDAFVIVLLFLPALESALLGKRGALLTIVLTYFLVSIWFSGKSSGSSLKKTTKLILVAVGALALIISLLSLRLEGNGSVLWMLEVGRVTELIDINRSLLYWVSELEGGARDLVAGVLGIVAYFVHGVYEYCYQYDAFLKSDAQLGGYTFWIVKKFLAMLGVGSFDIDVIANVPPRTFVYTTLFGPLYLDFLHYSVIFSFIIGYLACFSHYKAMNNILYLPLYIQFAIVILFYPVVNMLTMFQGLYNLVAAAAFLILGKVLIGLRTK